VFPPETKEWPFSLRWKYHPGLNLFPTLASFFSPLIFLHHQSIPCVLSFSYLIYLLFLCRWPWRGFLRRAAAGAATAGRGQTLPPARSRRGSGVRGARVATTLGAGPGATSGAATARRGRPVLRRQQQLVKIFFSFFVVHEIDN
jgi:hypothetical protein